MVPGFDQDKTFSYCSYACLVAVVGLLTIWVLPNTIALRHVLLGIGVIASIPIIKKSHFFCRQSIWELLPLLLLGSLFAWVLIHFTFFSLDRDLELQELKSIWLRAFAASIIAIGLSISLMSDERLKPYFFVSLFVVPLINLGAYIYLSYENGGLLLPADFVWKFIFKKIEAAFFGVISISIACANLIYLLSKKFDKNSLFAVVLWFIGITLALVSSIVANTKNGVAISLGLCLLFVMILAYKALRQKSKSWSALLVPALFIVMLLFGSWKVHTQFASQGWGTLLEDVQISSNLEQHNFWRYNSPHWNKVTGENFPTNSRGIDVAGNTYERVAWATQGISLISEHPMGFGSINRSFVGMLNYTKVQQELDSQTHSGWIDFGLAFGVPGLLILSAVFISILLYGIRYQNQFSQMGIWLIAAFIPFGVIAEICYKHNFEILIFFIAFAAASAVGIKGIKFQTK